MRHVAISISVRVCPGGDGRGRHRPAPGVYQSPGARRGAAAAGCAAVPGASRRPGGRREGLSRRGRRMRRARLRDETTGQGRQTDKGGRRREVRKVGMHEKEKTVSATSALDESPPLPFRGGRRATAGRGADVTRPAPGSFPHPCRTTPIIPQPPTENNRHGDARTPPIARAGCARSNTPARIHSNQLRPADPARSAGWFRGKASRPTKIDAAPFTVREASFGRRRARWAAGLPGASHLASHLRAGGPSGRRAGLGPVGGWVRGAAFVVLEAKLEFLGLDGPGLASAGGAHSRVGAEGGAVAPRSREGAGPHAAAARRPGAVRHRPRLTRSGQPNPPKCRVDRPTRAAAAHETHKGGGG